jgi:hypothetical protein
MKPVPKRSDRSAVGVVEAAAIEVGGSVGPISLLDKISSRVFEIALCARSSVG